MKHWNWGLRTKPMHAVVFAAFGVALAVLNALDPTWHASTPLGMLSLVGAALLLMPLVMVLFDRLRAR